MTATVSVQISDQDRLVAALHLLGARRLATRAAREDAAGMRVVLLLLRSFPHEERILTELTAIAAEPEGEFLTTAINRFRDHVPTELIVDAIEMSKIIGGVFGRLVEDDTGGFNPQPDPPGFAVLVGELVTSWREKNYTRALGILRQLLGKAATRIGAPNQASPDATLRAAVDRWAALSVPVSEEDQRLIDALIVERTRKATAYEKIKCERERQVSKGRDAVYDDARSWQDWIDCIAEVLAKSTSPLREQREATAIKLGSISVAILESIDRAPHDPEQPEGFPLPRPR